uniref:zinc finger protein 92-like n=1 Tax=Myxine glutinosa TaxID=7769 RepID=UPI00358FE4EE
MNILVQNFFCQIGQHSTTTCPQPSVILDSQVTFQHHWHRNESSLQVSKKSCESNDLVIHDGGQITIERDSIDVTWKRKQKKKMTCISRKKSRRRSDLDPVVATETFSQSSPTMYTKEGCEKDSCHVQPGSEQQTVLVCGMKVEETEGFPEILQIKIEDVNSFGLEEEQSYPPNDLFVKVEVKTEHDIDVHLDRPKPKDAEASFLKNHPHEGVSIESTRETAPTFMNSVDTGPQDPPTETNKRTFYKHNKRNNELFAHNNFHQAHKGEKDKCPYKCTSCGKSFNLSSTLKRHMMIHNGERPYKCTSCGKSFNLSSTLKQHMMIHNGERPYKCTSCGKSFNRSSTLKQHMMIHNGERPYKCTSCGKSFSQSSTLKKHKMIHNGERPHKCTSCGKSFNRLFTLKQHMMIHNGERPYKCTSCGKYFRHSSTLKKHMIIHNGVRPYKCTSCGKSFRHSSILKKHMIIHNGERPYKCTSCGKSFNQPYTLRQHIMIHNDEPPHKYTSCEKYFNRSSHFKLHRKAEEN